MNIDRTLVIIDMQDSFICCGDEEELIPAICKLCHHAKQNKWPIILVEFNASGRTTSAILEAVENYPFTETVTKETGSGGKEVMACLLHHPEWPLNLLVCGIYGPECVAETVAGLLDNSDLVEVDVIIDAIYPPYCSLAELDEHGQQREGEFFVSEIVDPEYLAQYETVNSLPKKIVLS